MSDKAVHYEIKITSVRMPCALSGVPLPIEIIPQEGQAKRSLITLEENHTETESVEWPGTYLVRTVLPSGQLIAKTTIVPQSSEPQGGASSEVTLDFGECIPVAEWNEPITLAQRLDAQHGRILETYNKYLPSRRGAVKKLRRVIHGGAIGVPRLSFDYGFIRWKPEEGLNASSEGSGDQANWKRLHQPARYYRVGWRNSPKSPSVMLLSKSTAAPSERVRASVRSGAVSTPVCCKISASRIAAVPSNNGASCGWLAESACMSDCGRQARFLANLTPRSPQYGVNTLRPSVALTRSANAALRNWAGD